MYASFLGQGVDTHASTNFQILDFREFIYAEYRIVQFHDSNVLIVNKYYIYLIKHG